MYGCPTTAAYALDSDMCTILLVGLSIVARWEQAGSWTLSQPRGMEGGRVGGERVRKRKGEREASVR